MTNELKNRKVKKIELNKEDRVVTFYSVLGELLSVDFVETVFQDRRYYSLESYSQYLARKDRITDYGLYELEKGNIILEFEDEATNTHDSVTKYVDSDKLEFKTELPMKYGKDYPIGYDSALDKIRILTDINDFVDVIQELREIIAKQDERLNKLEEQTRLQNTVNRSMSESIDELIKKVSKSEEEIYNLKLNQ